MQLAVNLPRPVLLHAVLVFVFLLPLAACGSNEAPLNRTALAHATYPSAYVPDSTVTLTGGHYENEAARTSISLADVVARGDLNGDGTPDAAVVLITNTGASASFRDLVAVINREGRPAPVTSTFLGDGIKLNGLTITEGIIHVRMTVYTRDDPRCCPSLPITQTYRLQNDRLVEQ